MSGIDWDYLSAVLLDRERLPLILLDAGGRVARVNRALRNFLTLEPPARWSDFDSEWVLPEGHEAFQRIWPAALRGERSRAAIPIRATAYAVIPVFEVVPLLENGALQSVMLVMVDTIAAEPAMPLTPALGFHYHVDLDEAGLPTRLRKVAAPDFTYRPDGRPCFWALHGRTTPCPTCPILSSSARSVTLRSTRPFSALLMAAKRNLDQTASVSSIPISEISWRELTGARVSALAQEAKLTEREVEVLDKLLVGRGLKDIADEIGISPRTAKYHQQNLLRKLGAESRADLLRLFS